MGTFLQFEAEKIKYKAPKKALPISINAGRIVAGGEFSLAALGSKIIKQHPMIAKTTPMTSFLRGGLPVKA